MDDDNTSEDRGRPDLISQSGREGDPLPDRAGPLRAALLYPPFTGVPVRSVTQAIHDVKLTAGWVLGVLEAYDSAIARGETQERLARGADLPFSPVECLVLAWRRGGHREYQRVRRDQKERGVRLWVWSDPDPILQGSPPSARRSHRD